MTEHLSFPEENFPLDPAFRRIDKLAEPAWQQFLDKALRIEQEINLYEPSDPSNLTLVELYIPLLHDSIENGDKAPQCKVSGFAYKEDSASSEFTQQVPLIDESAIYTGVNIVMIDDQWRVVIEVELPDADPQMPDNCYAFMVGSGDLGQLDFYIDQSTGGRGEPEKKPTVDLHTRLRQHAIVARDVISDEDFAVSEPVEQRRILDHLAQQVAAEIMPEHSGAVVSVNCKEYYATYDKMPDIDLKDSYTNILALPLAMRDKPVGVIERIGYPELDALPAEQVINLAALDVNDGAACVIVYNEELGRRYYIPSQHIISID